MDTKQEWLQKLQHALACSLAQGLSQPHLNESIFHDLRSPPPSDLYPHLHQWYMNMSKKIKSSLQREQTFFAQSEQENIEDDSRIQGSEFKAKNLNLKITNELTKLLQQFKNQFIQNYDKILDKEFQLMSQKLIIIQIYILQNFELLLYRIADIYYAKKKIYAQNLQLVYSEMQAQMLQTLDLYYKAPKQRFRALKLWIKQEFIYKVLNDNNYKDQIIKNFIIDLTADQQLYTDYFQMPFDKIFHRIVVVRDKQYDRTIRMVLSRYKNYPFIDIIEQNKYITDKAYYDNQGYSIYNSNLFFFCLQIQNVATGGKLIENQQTLLKKSLEKILLQPKGGSGNLILNTDCDFYRQEVLAYIDQNQPSDFTKYVLIMDNEKRWNTTSNLIKYIILNKTSIKYSRGKAIPTLIGTTAEEVANIHQLSPSLTTNDFIWKYEWTHMIATSLGGAYNYDNGFVGPSFFNRVMQRYQSWLVDINKDQNFDNHQLNNINYKVSLRRSNYTPKKPPTNKITSCNLGVFAEAVQIQIIAEYTIVEASPTGPKKVTVTVPLLTHQFNPFLKIYPMRIQKQLFQECVKQLCYAQQRRRLSLDKSDLKNKVQFDIGSQYYQSIRRNFFNTIRKYLKQRIQGQTLTLIDKGLSFKVKVRSSQDNPKKDDQEEFYSVQILQVQSDIFQKLCGMNILDNSLTKKLKIDEISFNINTSILGFFVRIRSKQLELPQQITSVVNKIFNFEKPVIVFQGAVHFPDNLLDKMSIPNYFQIKASLKESNKSQKNKIADLNYSFQELNLSLGFRYRQKKEKKEFEVDWSIGCFVNIYKLAKDKIKLSAIFRHNQGQSELQAKITERINGLMGISWLNVDQLGLKINFTKQEVGLSFACDIQTVRLSMKAFYGSKIITMRCSVEQLTINNIIAIISKFLGTKLPQVGLALTFENISLEITNDREKKENTFDFDIQIKISQTTFNGSLKYEKNGLQLQASADIIKFKILEETITLTQPKLSLISKEKYDQLRYTGEIGYQSKSQGNGGSVKTIIGVQRNKQSKKTNYWLQAKIRLDLEPKLGTLFSNLTPFDYINLVYKDDGYISQDSSNAGKYLAIKTKDFFLFSQKINLNIIFDFSKLTLAAEVNQDYDKNDKTSLFLLTKYGIYVKLTDIQVAIQVTCISPRLNNAIFTGALIFGLGKIGGEITMTGVQKINDNIQIGFEDPSKKTAVKLVYNNQAIDFQFSAAVRIYDFYGEGHIIMTADAITFVQVTVLNLDFAKILISFMNVLASDSKKDSIKISADQAKMVKLFVIEKLYFKYDVKHFTIAAQLNATIFNNLIKLEGKVSPTQIFLSADIENPISIINFISLSNALDSKYGPKIKIQLKPTTFKIQIDCKIHFGPISSQTLININSSKLTGILRITLFNLYLSAALLIDTQQGIYGFQIQFSKQERGQTDSFVSSIINAPAKNLQIETDPRKRRNELLRQTRQNRKKCANEHKEGLKRSRQQCGRKSTLMWKLFAEQTKKALKQLRAKNKQKIEQKQKEIRQKQIQARERSNYEIYHKRQNLTSNLNQNLNKTIKEGRALIQSLKTNIKILQEQKQQLQFEDPRDNSQFQDLDKIMRNNLRGGWDTFTSWVKSAYDTIKQFIMNVIDLLPQVTAFKIGARLQGPTHLFKAYCKFTFKAFGVSKDINLQWDAHFDSQTIEQKAITEMTQFSLEYVRSVYLIPKPIYQQYKFKDLEQTMRDLEEGNLKGLNVKYNPSLKKNTQQYLRQKPYLSFGNAQSFDIYKDQKQPEYKYCLSKTLYFRNQYTNTDMQMTKYFCNAMGHYSTQSAILIGQSKKQDLIKAGFGGTSTPKLQINMNQLKYFKITDVKIGNVQYKHYELLKQRFTMIRNSNGQYQPVLIQYFATIQQRHDNIKESNKTLVWFVESKFQEAFNQIKDRFNYVKTLELQFGGLWKQIDVIPKPDPQDFKI